MPWQYRSTDNSIEVIVDPDFGRDVAALASQRPVWIVDTLRNRPRIDAVWAVGADANLFEVSRYDAPDPNDRKTNLLEILGCLDDHYPHHDLMVHGISPEAVGAWLEEEGFRITEATPDGFAAIQDVRIRDRLIGRS